MNKKRYILVVGIILIGAFSLIVLNNKLDSKETKLDEVKLKENKVDKNSFAIMIQKEDKTGYEEYNENTWPTNMVYNSELSGCIDNYGKTIENSLSYNQETNKVTIHTAVTTSCYLYFDLDKEAPIVSATVNNNNSTNATITISSNETGTYCVNTSSAIIDMSNCTFSGSITKDSSITTSVFTTKGDYYVHLTDSAGNIGISSLLSISVGTPIGEYILANPPTGLNKTISYNGMYRFIGTAANNYVSIGGVLYQIIGITSESNSTLGLETGQLKVIKAASIGKNTWHSTGATSATWNAVGTNAVMYTYLQSDSVLGNTSYIPSGWSDKIDSVKWYVGDVSIYDNATQVVDYENNTVTNSTSKIGLMYLSDYYYAYNAGGTVNCYNVSCKNWMTDSSNETWTMTRYGYSSYYDYYLAWRVLTGGDVGFNFMNYTYAVRPVFYLNIDVYITNPGATGSSTNPFILSY